MDFKEYERRRHELFDMYRAKKIRSDEAFKKLMALEEERKKGRRA